MADLAVSDFPLFFEEVTGHEPFLWQVELTERLAKGHIPKVIDVPTGFGKTSAIHCWAFALAVTSEMPSVPRRLSFVVDRRLIVDAAWEEGESLSARLESSLEAGDVGPVGAVAQRLVSMHADRRMPALQVVRMRGGVTWESRWLARPDAPALIVGTVDQFGSRLLFRGYSASDRMRPIDAALLGLDSWLVIDEAHIAEPLVRTASAVATYQTTTDESLPVKSLQVTLMSATPSPAETTLQADLEKETSSRAFLRAAEQARNRLSAEKPAVLVDIEDLSEEKIRRWHEGSTKLGQALAELARGTHEEARVVGVIANTIATARSAHARLEQAGEQAILLIGRCRAYERERLLAEWLPLISVGAQRSSEYLRLFVVATQTVEVGANLDFDTIVTESAPLPSLIQRFGRVNRLGVRERYLAAIVHAGFAHGAQDPVYGASTGTTWERLINQVEPIRVRTTELSDFPTEVISERSIDLGLLSSRDLMEEARNKSLPVTPEAPFVPTLLGPHLDRWVGTHPRPFPDQSVGPFLHGVDRFVPEVDVAWRAAPPDDVADAQSWGWWLDLVRPLAWEFVRIPIWELYALLQGQPSKQATADLEELQAAEAEELDLSGKVAREDRVFGVVYRGPEEEPRLIQTADDVNIGDRVVLDAALGGHDKWGWCGAQPKGDHVVTDVGDLAEGRSRRVLRLHPAPLSTFVREGDRHEMTSRLSPILDSLGNEENPLAERVDAVQLGEITGELAALMPTPLANLLSESRHWQIAPMLDAAERRAVLLLLEPVHATKRRASMDAISDTDVLSTSAGFHRQPLADHHRQVAILALQFAKHLRLPDAVGRAIEWAAKWHDAGKADPRFQVSLHDGDELAAMTASQPIAKSGRDYRDPVARQAHVLSGLPNGFRHEAVSATLVQALVAEHAEKFEGVDIDLIHHLVASHHGQARPLFRPIADPNSPQVVVELEGLVVKVEGGEQLDWEHPCRFERLNQRYGWWGLALLESILRLADMRCSEDLP